MWERSPQAKHPPGHAMGPVEARKSCGLAEYSGRSWSRKLCLECILPLLHCTRFCLEDFVLIFSIAGYGMSFLLTNSLPAGYGAVYNLNKFVSLFQFSVRLLQQLFQILYFIISQGLLALFNIVFHFWVE